MATSWLPNTCPLQSRVLATGQHLHCRLRRAKWTLLLELKHRWSVILFTIGTLLMGLHDSLLSSDPD